MNIKRLILIALNAMFWTMLLFVPFGHAQIYAPTEELEKQYRPPLNQEGRLVSLKYEPAGNDLRFYIAGKDAGRFLSPSDVDFRAYVENADELTPISSTQEGDFFQVAVDPERTQNLGIEVRYKGDVETFRVNAQPSSSGPSGTPMPTPFEEK